MQLIRITREFKETEKLYALNDEAFPASERIPSPKLLAALEEFSCDAYAFYEDTVFVGFAVLLTEKERKMAYLSYFAIDAAFRSRGYGAKALAKLAQHYTGYQIALDMERMDKTAENYEQRVRRLAFYQRNGYKRAGVGFRYFGMDLEIMNNNGTFREADFKALLDKIKLEGFHPEMYPLGEVEA